MAPMAPMGKFKNSVNCYNSGCTQDKVVIYDSVYDFRGRPI